METFHKLYNLYFNTSFTPLMFVPTTPMFPYKKTCTPIVCVKMRITSGYMHWVMLFRRYQKVFYWQPFPSSSHPTCSHPIQKRMVTKDIYMNKKTIGNSTQKVVQFNNKYNREYAMWNNVWFLLVEDIPLCASCHKPFSVYFSKHDCITLVCHLTPALLRVQS